MIQVREFLLEKDMVNIEPIGAVVFVSGWWKNPRSCNDNAWAKSFIRDENILLDNPSIKYMVVFIHKFQLHSKEMLRSGKSGSPESCCFNSPIELFKYPKWPFYFSINKCRSKIMNEARLVRSSDSHRLIYHKFHNPIFWSRKINNDPLTVQILQLRTRLICFNMRSSR